MHVYAQLFSNPVQLWIGSLDLARWSSSFGSEWISAHWPQLSGKAGRRRDRIRQLQRLAAVLLSRKVGERVHPAVGHHEEDG